jgi:hypothetical protein
MARNRTRSTDGRKPNTPKSASRMPGLRWVPVPLAFLMAAIGWLVLGSVVGQHSLAASRAGPEQGGMGLKLNQVAWMQDDMANPGTTTNPSQFQMPQSMMPGMQTAGDKRLRIEFYLQDISNVRQVYGLAEFRLLGTGHKSWSPLDNAATRGAPLAATLYPGFTATVDLYFDLPASQSGALRLEWEHGGHIMTIPLHVAGSMVGM